MYIFKNYDIAFSFQGSNIRDNTHKPLINPVSFIPQVISFLLAGASPVLWVYYFMSGVHQYFLTGKPRRKSLVLTSAHHTGFGRHCSFI